jgi:signal transduction histidine kinase
LIYTRVLPEHSGWRRPADETRSRNFHRRRRRFVTFFENLSVRNKIFAGYAVLLVPFAALVVMTVIMTRGIMHEFGELRDDSLPVLARLEAVRTAGLRVIESTNTFALLNTFGKQPGQTQSSFSIDKKSDMMRAREDFSVALMALRGLSDPDGGGAQWYVQNITVAHTNIMKQSDRLIELVAEAATPATILQYRERFENSALNFRNLIQRAVEAENSELSARQAALSERLRTSLIIGSALGALGVILALLGGIHVSRRVATPIRRLRDSVVRIGEGDFEAIEQPRSGDEVGELVGAFGKMAEKLQQLMTTLTRQERLATLGQVAGTVSHELRNPLAAIRSSMAIIHQATLHKGLGIERALERAERNIDRCADIIGSLLDFTRLRDLNRQATAIDAWLGEILDEQALPEEIELRREFTYGGEITIDRERFRQAVANLVDNAAQATMTPEWQPPDGAPRQITVRSEAAGPHLRLSVADNGPGIPADMLARIFEPLFTTRSFGVGLGLPTVQQIVEQHGGTIHVDSAPGRGTTFTISLPRQADRSEPPSADAA